MLGFQLEDLLRESILVMDGAMGTMIQRRELKEEDYRGKEFAKHAKVSLPDKKKTKCFKFGKPSRTRRPCAATMTCSA